MKENEWWALAQHHGLATPLLDWTYSPFVALFFAFEEAGYIGCTDGSPAYCEPEERAVLAVPFHLIGKNGSPENTAPSVFTLHRESTRRLTSQSGVFMEMPKGLDLEASVRVRFPKESPGDLRPPPQSILTKITIPNKGREECLKFLNKMNINRSSLFGDLDGAATYINSLWELNFDTALGRLPDGSVRITPS